MKKIRINELARELEVKAHEILERLPEVGVSEKKTHSSSIDEDAAVRLRRLYGHDVPDYVPDESDVAEEEHREAAQAEPAESGPTGPAAEGGEAAQPVSAAREEGAPERPAEGPAAAAEGPALGEARPVAPIRPPLAGRPDPPARSGGASAGSHPAPAPAEAPAPAVPAARAPGPAGSDDRARTAHSSVRQAVAHGAQAGPDTVRSPSAVSVGADGSGAPRRPGPAAPHGYAPASAGAAEARRPEAPRETARAGTLPLAGGPVPQRTLAGQPAARPVVPPQPTFGREACPAQADDAGALRPRPGRGFPRRMPRRPRDSPSIAVPSVPDSPWWPGLECIRARPLPDREAVRGRNIRRRSAAAVGTWDGAAARGPAARTPGRQARGPAAAGARRGRESSAPRAAARGSRSSAHQPGNHHFGRHHRQGAFGKAGREGRPAHQEADGPRHLPGHQPDARFQTGHGHGARVRRLHGDRQL